MLSNEIKQGHHRAPHRGLLRATGQIRSADDSNKPFVAVCNSHVDTIRVDDGIVMGHEGMRYSLPPRELIAGAVATMVRAHCFDALICTRTATRSSPAWSWALV